MSGFGFKKAGEQATPAKGMDLSGLPSGAPPITPSRERDAIERGEALGFRDRGQGGAEPGRGGRRKRPAPAPKKTLYIRAPEDLAEWFERYTEDRGHNAFWQSIGDFRELVERREGRAADAEE